MNTVSTVTIGRRSARGIGFTAITLFLGTLLILVGSLIIGGTWALDGARRMQEIHFFHNVVEGVGLGYLVGFSLLVAGISFTRNRLVVQYLLIYLVLIAIAGLLVEPVALIVALVILGLIILLYPQRRALFDVRTGFNFNPYTAVFGLIVAAPLLVNAIHNLTNQMRKVGGEHYQFGHWAVTTLTEIGLILAVLLIATGLPGWRYLSLISGLSLLILGITSLIVPDYAGSWGVVGGLLAVLAGVGYLTFPVWSTTGSAAEPALETVPTT